MPAYFEIPDGYPTTNSQHIRTTKDHLVYPHYTYDPYSPPHQDLEWGEPNAAHVCVKCLQPYSVLPMANLKLFIARAGATFDASQINEVTPNGDWSNVTGQNVVHVGTWDLKTPLCNINPGFLRWFDFTIVKDKIPPVGTPVALLALVETGEVHTTVAASLYFAQRNITVVDNYLTINL